MSKTRQNPDSGARTDRSERLTAAGVIAAYIHEISGRHLDDRMLTEPSLGGQTSD